MAVLLQVCCSLCLLRLLIYMDESFCAAAEACDCVVPCVVMCVNMFLTSKFMKFLERLHM